MQKNSPVSRSFSVNSNQRHCCFMNFIALVYLGLLFIVLFAKNCTNQIKSNYLNSHGEEAQEKPRAYKEWAPSVR